MRYNAISFFKEAASMSQLVPVCPYLLEADPTSQASDEFQ